MGWTNGHALPAPCSRSLAHARSAIHTHPLYALATPCVQRTSATNPPCSERRAGAGQRLLLCILPPMLPHKLHASSHQAPLWPPPLPSPAANRVLVLASDGLWDAVDNEEATQLALKWRAAGAEYAARALCMEAYARGSQDNITAVVSGAGRRHNAGQAADRAGAAGAGGMNNSGSRVSATVFPSHLSCPQVIFFRPPTQQQPQH